MSRESENEEAEETLREAAARGATVIVWTMEDLERENNRLLRNITDQFKAHNWAAVERFARDLAQVESRLCILQARHALDADIANI